MNQLQIARQIQYLLQTRYWAGNSSNSRVFGKVVISAMPLRDILMAIPRTPLAVVRMGAEVNDPDFPEIVLDAGISVEVAVGVLNDSYGEAALVGGPRTDLTKSQGRGLGEVMVEALAAINRNDPETGISLFSRVGSAGQAISLKDTFFHSKSIEASAKGGIVKFYHPARDISNSAGTLSWTNPPDRFDFHAAIAGLGIAQRGNLILRYASGSTPPATVTDGSGATLSGDFATSYVHGTDGQGSGTFSYSLFGAYDFTGNGTNDAFSAALTLTGSF